jgi:hypothetical protein
MISSLQSLLKPLLLVISHPIFTFLRSFLLAKHIRYLSDRFWNRNRIIFVRMTILASAVRLGYSFLVVSQNVLQS